MGNTKREGYKITFKKLPKQMIEEHDYGIRIYRFEIKLQSNNRWQIGFYNSEGYTKLVHEVSRNNLLKGLKAVIYELNILKDNTRWTFNS